MASATVALRLGSARLRVAAHPDVLALGGLTTLFLLLAASTWQTWGDLGVDTGYDLVAAQRVAAGEVPYLDFTYFYGPLSPAVVGLVTWLGGGGLAPAVTAGLALTAAIVLVTYGLGRRYGGPVAGLAAGAITTAVAFSPNNFSYPLPHTYSATLGLLTALCFLLALGCYADSGRQPWLLAAGACAGLTALTRPEFELAVLAAAALWLLLRARAGLGGIRELVLFAAPALLIPAVVYGAFLTVVSPHRLFLENLYPREELAAAGNSILRTHAPFTLSSFAELGGRLLLYAAGAAVLVLVGRALAGSGPRRRAAGAAALLAGGAVVVVALGNPEALRHGLQYVYGWIPAGALAAVAVYLWRFRRREGPWSAAAQAELAGLVVLAVLALKTYAAFFMHAPFPQIAVYAAPLAALFLTRLHLRELAPTRAAFALGALWLAFLAAAGVGLALKDAKVESATVTGPGGALASEPSEARGYQAALRWIEQTTESDEAILLVPQLTTLYVLAERESPLPRIDLLPGALPDADAQRAVIGRLEEAGVRLIVTDGHAFGEYGHTSFGDSFDRVLATWIRNHYELGATLAAGPSHTLDVWVREVRP